MFFTFDQAGKLGQIVAVFGKIGGHCHDEREMDLSGQIAYGAEYQHYAHKLADLYSNVLLHVFSRLDFSFSGVKRYPTPRTV